jgi:two-component system, chemotaxis family, protein-glutamate methylesterase/glutaminase
MGAGEPSVSHGSGRGRRDLVVIGASAGGVETLRRLVAGLPENLQAAVCIVLHIAPSSPSALAQILHRAGPLPCRAAEDGDRLRHGEILVAPPDRHLVIEASPRVTEPATVRLTLEPKENGHRPSVDILFRSAAEVGDGRVIGVILSGSRDDGTAGMAAIKTRGGATIVQDPADALYPSMPRSAIDNVAIDVVAGVDALPGEICAMVEGQPAASPRGARSEASSSEGAPGFAACPECGEVLSEQPASGIEQWRCQIGHRYSSESLADEQAVGVEAALWTAIRALTERGSLLDRMAEEADARGHGASARRFRAGAGDARTQADVVRRALQHASASTLLRLSHLEGAEVVETQTPR